MFKIIVIYEFKIIVIYEAEMLSGKISDMTVLDPGDHMLETLSNPDSEHCECLVGSCRSTCGTVLFS